MAGFINSPTQAAILNTIEAVGPVTSDYLIARHGNDVITRHMGILRSAGYVYNLTIRQREWWIEQGYGRFSDLYQKNFLDFLTWVEEQGGELIDGIFVIQGMQYAPVQRGDKLFLLDIDGREIKSDKLINKVHEQQGKQGAADDYARLFAALNSANKAIRAGDESPALLQQAELIKEQLKILQAQL